MSTALDLINLAEKAVGTLGVGQTLLAEDINDAFMSLKQMISVWQKKRWLVPYLIDVRALGNNQVSNKIGLNQYYNVPRPDKIQAAFVRLNATAIAPGDFNSNDFDNTDFNVSLPTVSTVNSSSVDYQLVELPSYEDYSKIPLKGLNSFPRFFFYDAAYPYGNLFIWPIPTAMYDVHIIVKSYLQNLSEVNSDILFPEEYDEAIWSNLALRLCILYQISASRELVALAKSSLNTIRIANCQIPELSMPQALINRNGYNFYSDSTW